MRFDTEYIKRINMLILRCFCILFFKNYCIFCFCLCNNLFGRITFIFVLFGVDIANRYVINNLNKNYISIFCEGHKTFSLNKIKCFNEDHNSQ